MITEIWVWYDEEKGDLPLIMKVGEVAAMFEATFQNFYGWAECHNSYDAPTRFSNPSAIRGLYFRPRCPEHVTVRMVEQLKHHAGVEQLEVKVVNYLGDGAVRKMHLMPFSR